VPMRAQRVLLMKSERRLKGGRALLRGRLEL
jgi:hypothetical protein